MKCIKCNEKLNLAHFRLYKKQICNKCCKTSNYDHKGLFSSEKTKINEILKSNLNDLAIESKIFKIEKLKASIEDTKKELKTLLKNDYKYPKESKLQR